MSCIYLLYPTIMALFYRWYHHKMSRSEAEAVLEDKADFSFLVRESESSRDPYSLSIR